MQEIEDDSAARPPTGTTAPVDPNAPTFSESKLRPELKGAIAALGFTHPTAVQTACLEAGIGQDLVVQAKTGSGKTLAFGLPILEALEPGIREPQALVLAPTRELALQIAKALAPLARALDVRCIPLTGGAEMRPQLKALASSSGSKIVIGTPGRVLDHLNRSTLSPDRMKTVVLDEGDHLLDMGFKDEIDAILSSLPEDRRTLLFSATLPPEVEALASRHTKNPRKLTIDRGSVAHADIEHQAYPAPANMKVETLANILLFERSERSVVFCATRQGARELSERLPLLGIPAGLISGELDQTARNRALDAFREGRCHVLVATDVAARGIDVPATTHVVHFSLADTPEAYVHRSGRTGRAGRKGTAISLVAARERGAFARLVKGVGVKIKWKEVPQPLQIRRRRIELLVDRLVAEPEDEALRTPQALEHAQRLRNSIPEGAPLEPLLARVLDVAVELEGEPGYDLADAIKAEAAAPFPRRVGSRDDRKVPRQERWARRDARAGGGHHGGPAHGGPRPHGRPHGDGPRGPHAGPRGPHAGPRPPHGGKPHGGKPHGGKPWPQRPKD